MITMHLAVDALAGMDADAQVIDGSTELEGIRIGMDAPRQCIAIYKEDGGVICSNGNDRIAVADASLEEVANRLLGYFDRIDAWEKALLSIGGGDSIQRFIDMTSPILGNPILITDDNSMTTAISSEPAGTVNVEWDHIIKYGRMSWRENDLVYSDAVARSHMTTFLEPFLYKPPELPDLAINCHIPDRSGKKCLVTFVMIGKRPITRGDMQLVQRISQILHAWLLARGEGERAFMQLDFIARIARGEHVGEEELLLQKRRMGYGSEECVLVRIVHPDVYSFTWTAAMLERRIERCRAFESDGWIYALCPVTPHLDEVFATLSSEFDLRFGLSWPFSDWNRMALASEQAEMALAYAPGPVAKLDSRCALEYMLAMLGSAMDSDGACHPAVARLAAYDDAHNSDLLHTLWVYLRLERNQVATAAALGLHRNSLLYRVGRIEELVSPIDLSDPDVREHLMLSMRLFRLEQAHASAD